MPLPKVEVRPVGLRLSGELCGRVYFFKVGTESSATRRAGLEPTVGHRLKANTALRPPAETRTTRSKPVAHSSAGTGKPCLSFSLALLSLLILTRHTPRCSRRRHVREAVAFRKPETVGAVGSVLRDTAMNKTYARTRSSSVSFFKIRK